MNTHTITTAMSSLLTPEETAEINRLYKLVRVEFNAVRECIRGRKPPEHGKPKHDPFTYNVWSYYSPLHELEFDMSALSSLHAFVLLRDYIYQIEEHNWVVYRAAAVRKIAKRILKIHGMP